MATTNGTFTTDQESSLLIRLNPGHSVTYSITTSALTGSVIFETSENVQAGFTIVDTMTATDSGTYQNGGQQPVFTRIRCEAIGDGETVDYTLGEVDDESSQDFINPETGKPELSFTDSGAIFHRHVKCAVVPTHTDHLTNKAYVDAVIPATITVADTTDSTCFVGLFESATGNIAPKTDSALTYDASTGAFGATSVTATTLTGTISTAAQPNITSLGTIATLSVGSITASGTVDGRDVSVDGTKLDGIETGATADQTAAEIRTLVDSATDSNVFTDSDKTKLDGIEASADVTDSANVISSLNGASITSVTVAGSDKVLVQDVSDSDNLKQVTAQSIADLFVVTTNANLTGPITSTGNATAVAAQTGTGSTFVMSQSPTLVTPNIGAASATSITVSGTVDGRDISADGATLDDLVTDVAALDQSVVLKGTWDASAGTFPGSGTAQAGFSWIVSVSGTVDGVAFVLNDRIVSILDNASTSTYAANWHKLDYTDAVLSVASRTGAVTITSSDLSDFATAVANTAAVTANTAKLTADTTNVTAAGALMDSEVTNLAQVKAFSSADYATASQGTLADNALPRSGGAMTGAITTNSTFDGRDVSVDGAKLDGIEALADVTDTANVTAAGALMDSEVTNLAAVKAFNPADYATAAQGTTADAALPKAGGTMTGSINMGGQNITDVNQLQIDAVPTSNQTGNGFTTRDFNAGATIGICTLCEMAVTGKWVNTDASSTTTSTGLLSVSLEAGTNNNPMRVALSGSIVRNDSWNWTIGAKLYVSPTSGVITETAPSTTGEVIRIIGHALTPDVLYFNPDNYWTVAP